LLGQAGCDGCLQDFDLSIPVFRGLTLLGPMKNLKFGKYKLFCPFSVTPTAFPKIDHGFKKGFRCHISWFIYAGIKIG
jgi:hypothetical protein